MGDMKLSQKLNPQHVKFSWQITKLGKKKIQNRPSWVDFT